MMKKNKKNLLIAEMVVEVVVAAVAVAVAVARGSITININNGGDYSSNGGD
jgi:hypothetical protein